MPSRYVYFYLPLWAGACLLAVVLAAQKPSAFTILHRPYWKWLCAPWKLCTFAVAFGLMVFGAPYSGDPTWDYVDGGVQSLLTFTTAPWVVATLYRRVRSIGSAPSPREVYGALATWFFSASGFYDGWNLYRHHYYPSSWSFNLIASSFLYWLGGALWSLGAPLGSRAGFSFTDPAWPNVAGESFRRSALLAFAIVAAVILLLLPFAIEAWQDLHPSMDLPEINSKSSSSVIDSK